MNTLTCDLPFVPSRTIVRDKDPAFIYPENIEHTILPAPYATSSLKLGKKTPL